MQTRPNISNTLLWEYDIPNFHWDKSYKIVIERVLIMGDIKEWQEIFKFYGRDKIVETINWSKQLSEREKDFSLLFVDSGFVNAA